MMVGLAIAALGISAVAVANASTSGFKGKSVDKVAVVTSDDTSFSVPSSFSAWYALPGIARTMSIPAGEVAALVIRFSGHLELEIACPNGDDCWHGGLAVHRVRALVNGVEASPQSLSDTNTSPFITLDRVSGALGQGTYSVEVQALLGGDWACDTVCDAAFHAREVFMSVMRVKA
jgi:hypothetical protein